MSVLNSSVIIGFCLLLLPLCEHEEQTKSKCKCCVSIQDSQPESQLIDATGHQIIEGHFVDKRTTSEPFRRTLVGKFELAWDDSVDPTLDEPPKTCVIEFNEIDGKLNGNFIGPVAGTNRNAIISGRLEGEGTSRILTFQQREEDYICSYQAIDNGGAIVGVWHDTKNRSGSFRLLKYQ